MSSDSERVGEELAGPNEESPPDLMRDASFWGLTATQFLGAFNDNLFKQILLLLFVAVPVAGGTKDLQGLGQFLFALPFILFSGYGGYLSDRHNKRGVIILCKVAEIVIMALGVPLFFWYAFEGLSPLLVGLLGSVLFCMGAQSGFFGPAKYGILPEMLRHRDLPAANGIILMTTFLAIILGSALAGLLLKLFPERLWVSGSVCVAIAVVGTATSTLVRRVRPASPHLAFDVSALWIPREIRRLLAGDQPLRHSVVVSTVFWLAAAMVQLVVNALGKLQLKVDDFATSAMVSVVSLGIVVGSVVAGVTSQKRFNVRVLRIGAWGLVTTLTLLAVPGFGGRPHFLGYWACLPTLVLLGGFTGLFAVPLQVFLQSRPPREQRGRLIATVNLLNWVGIALSSGLYTLGSRVLDVLAWPPSIMFGFTALCILALAIGYRPHDVELRETPS